MLSRGCIQACFFLVMLICAIYDLAPATAQGLGSVAAASPHSDGAPSSREATGGSGLQESGFALMSAGRYVAAISAFEQMEPKSAGIYNQMGIAAEHMYMIAKAEDSFRRAIAIDNGSASAYNNLGTLYHGMRAYGKAEKCYKKALNLDPRSAVAEKNLGTLYFAKRKYKQGELAYARAFALDKAVFARSGALEIAGDKKNEGDLNYHMARMFAQTGDANTALDYLQKAVARGFHDRRRLLGDDAFATMRSEPAFARLVAEMGS